MAFQVFKLFGSIFLQTDEADKSLDNINKKGKKTEGNFNKMAGAIGKFGLVAGAMAGAFAVGVGVKAVGASEELQKALNGLQAETDSTDEEMEGFEDTLLDIYNNNFGESFEDIAKSMAKVEQATGLAGDELKNATKNALLLRDTFEIEVGESVDAVNSLVNAFGIESERAFELIAIGAQEGANKNGDLVTILSEYAPQFNALGLSADEFTQVLINGAQDGAFQVDKIGDALKEFNIRSKDMSKTSREAFEALGLDASLMFQQFGKGGESARKAFDTVMSALGELENDVYTNQIGVQLFGTQFEDLEVGALKNFTNINNKVSETTGVLERINSVKYNTFGEAISGITRQLETGILIPIGDLILPILNKFANWLNEKMPAIKNLFGRVLDFIKQKFSFLSDEMEGNFGKTIKDIVSKVLPPIIDLFKKIYDIYLPALMETFSTVFSLVETVVTTVVGNIVEYILPPLLEILETIYTVVMPKVFEIFNQLLPKIEKLWKDLWVILEPLLWLIKKTFDLVFPIIKQMVSDAFTGIGITLNLFMDLLNVVIGFISGIFTTNWKQVWEDVKGIFVGVFESLVGVGKGLINQLIGFLNKGINAMNKLSFSVPDWVPSIGGKSFSLGIKNIPKLAEGGTITQAGTVMVGERGAELLDLPRGAKVTPLNKQGLTININGATIMGEDDADWLGELLTDKLKALGVVP